MKELISMTELYELFTRILNHKDFKSSFQELIIEDRLGLDKSRA